MGLGRFGSACNQRSRSSGRSTSQSVGNSNQSTPACSINLRVWEVTDALLQDTPSKTGGTDPLTPTPHNRHHQQEPKPSMPLKAPALQRPRPLGSRPGNQHRSEEPVGQIQDPLVKQIPFAYQDHRSTADRKSSLGHRRSAPAQMDHPRRGTKPALGRHRRCSHKCAMDQYAVPMQRCSRANLTS